MVRTALVGLGSWGRTILPKLALHTELIVCANASADEGRAWLTENHPGIGHTFDVSEVFGNPDLDAVVLATPIATHVELAIAALSAGKHVLVEKPLATSSAEARAVVSAAEQADRCLLVGHVFTFDPRFERLKEVVAGKDLREMSLEWSKFGSFEEPLVWNLMVHDVALLLSLWGRKPNDIRISRSAGIVTELDLCAVALSFSDASRARIIVDRAAPLARKRMALQTSDGGYHVWEDDRLFSYSGGAFKEIAVARNDALDRELETFSKLVAAGSFDRDTAAFARDVVDVTEQIQSALASGS